MTSTNKFVPRDRALTPTARAATKRRNHTRERLAAASRKQNRARA